MLHDFATRAHRFGIEPTVILPKSGLLEDALREAGVRTAIASAEDSFLELSQRTTLTAGGLARFVRGTHQWSRTIGEQLSRLASEGFRRPAVLYSNGFKAHAACTVLRGYRRVWHLHEFPPGGLDLMWRLLAGAVPNRTIANSASVASAWRLGALGAPTPVLNGVDLDRFKPGPRSHWIHDLLALPHEARLIGMPAVFARWKGHLLVVEAFERIAGRIPDAHLVLVGGPIYDTVAEIGYAEELSRRVRRSSQSGVAAPKPLSDRIHFVKFQTEPWKLYGEFDLVVHFSTRPEPFGRVVVEAMACGVPVIAAGAGGPAEIVQDGVTGWLTPIGDVNALSARLVSGMATDLGAMRIAARRAAEGRFSADRFAEQVASVLRASVTAPNG